MADTRYRCSAPPIFSAARLRSPSEIEPYEGRDRNVELILMAGPPGQMHRVDFLFTPGDAETVARLLYDAANQLLAIYSEVRPL